MTHLWLEIKKRCAIAQRQKTLDAAFYEADAVKG